MSFQKQLNPPDLSVVLDAAARETKLDVNCIQIGTIQAFDSSNQTATVKIAMKYVESVDVDGVRTLNDYPLLLECPVFVLYGGTDQITMGISKGDSCIILFNDRQIDNWLNFGEGRAPNVSRVHDMSDGIALVGLKPFTQSIDDYFENGLRISHGSSAIIELSDDLIETKAELLKHNGDVEITEDLLVQGGMTIIGDVTGNLSEEINIDANVVQPAGREIHAGNGATGTFTSVTVVDGIVTGGT